MNFKEAFNSFLSEDITGRNRLIGQHRNRMDVSKTDKHLNLVPKKYSIKCEECGKKDERTRRVTIKKELPRIEKKFLCPACQEKNK